MADLTAVILTHEPRQSVAVSDSRRVSFLWRCFAIVGMTTYESAFTQTFRFLRGDDRLIAGESELSNTVLQVLLLAVLPFALWPYRARLMEFFRGLVPYFIVLALCMASAAWSDFPLLTIRRSGTLGICLAFGLWCYLAFGMAGFVSLLGRLTAVLGLISILFFLVVPAAGHESALGYEDAMRGVFSQKNTLGAAMLLGVTCYMHEIIAARRILFGAWAVVGFLVLCELMAKSASSLGVTFVVIAITGLFRLERNWRLALLYSFLGMAICISLSAMILLAPEVIFAAINRDPSFTGRLPLWSLSAQIALDRPLLGYGYSGFWTEDSTLAQYVWAMVNWKAPNAHNGYIDIVLQIGIVGLSIYLFMWQRIIVQAWIAWRAYSFSIAKWILLFMTVNIILNLDEGPLPYPDEFTMLMPGVILSLETWWRGYRWGKLRPFRKVLLRRDKASASG